MSYYGDINIPFTHGMDREDEEEMNINANADPINCFEVRTETENSKRHQTPQHTEMACVKIRSSRATAVCLVLLCVLLLTAVIVLGVYIHTKSTNYTEEKKQLLTKITNITEERDQLLTKITNIAGEKDQLLTKNTNLTEEKGQLLTNNTNLTEERDQLLTNNTNLTEERDQLLTNITNLTEERDQLLTNNINLTEERGQLLTNITNLTEERDALSSNNSDLIKQRNQLNQEKNELLKMDGWVYYQYSFYLISSEKRSWTESRRYCTDRGADLIIINNKAEQDFIKKIFCSQVWIGLTDSEVEGSWKWVDGSTQTSGFWASEEPGGHRGENCALTRESGWADYPCNDKFKCICEKSI
ncbi:C-type lectin domain family 4 member K-like [Megalobrama amblycephala]|uniref:C-type lectin domain family 4 member K-like n=1 Tax=Megalobrama amblycephala TaxID=75352 RepID=UPI00201454CC|nr:C-type lectin domain family 4 member K-like [Megalobrama amblycephala]XP_048036218.1 C-type lectin domain family 4 member K-like [Megalobrama amblycephala]